MWVFFLFLKLKNNILEPEIYLLYIPGSIHEYCEKAYTNSRPTVLRVLRSFVFDCLNTEVEERGIIFLLYYCSNAVKHVSFKDKKFS